MKTSRKIILSLAAVLLFVLCFVSFVFCAIFWLETDGWALNAGECEILSRALGFDIAPDDVSFWGFHHGFWPGTVSSLFIDADVESEEDFLSRCHEKTAFELRSYNYEGKDFYCAELSIDRGSEFMTKELERMLKSRDSGQDYMICFAGFCVVLVGEAALGAIAIAERIKRRKARKEKSDTGVDDAVHAVRGIRKALRIVVRVLAVVLVPVMTMLTITHLGPLTDGGDLMSMRAGLADGQQKELARLLGFDLARGESLDFRLYKYRYFTADEMYFYVNGIFSEDEFLARFPDAVNVKTERNPWDRYALYGSSDIILSLGPQTAFHVTGRTGRPALRYVKKIIITQGDARDRFAFVLPYIIIFGWLADFALIIVPIVMQGKAKKKRALESPSL